MRVLFALDSYWPNVDGVAVSLDRVAWALAQRGHAVSVLAPRIGHAAERPGPVAVQRLPAVRWPGSAAHLALPRARGWIEEWRPDLVVIALPFPIGLAALRAARATGRPVIGVTSTMPAWLSARLSLPRWGTSALEALLWGGLVACYERCTSVIAVSRTALGLLRRHGLTRPACVISNGVPLDTFRPRPRDGNLAARLGVPAKPTVLYTGRLDADKRLDRLLSGFALLRARYDAHLLLVGDGAARRTVQCLARQVGLAADVTMTGFLPPADYARVFSLADVFAITSPAELQSIATLEALASGLPVVAVAAGALPELVVDGVNGRLVPPNAPTALADTLAEVLTQAERRAALGRAARRTAEGHDLRRTLDAYESVLGAVAQAHRAEATSAGAPLPSRRSNSFGGRVARVDKQSR